MDDSIQYTHKQVDTSRTGIRVDEGILPLIEALWAAGIETTFSCQGNDETITKRLVTTDSDGKRVTETTCYIVTELTGNETGEVIETGITQSYISFPTYEDLNAAVLFIANLLDATSYGYSLEQGVPLEHLGFSFRISLFPWDGAAGIYFTNVGHHSLSHVLQELEDRKSSETE